LENSLVITIKKQTDLLFDNVLETFAATPDNLLPKECAGLLLWQHFYHMLHSLDQWYINPNEYADPQFHKKGMSSLDSKRSESLSKTELVEYFGKIRIKIEEYLGHLADDDLDKPPPNCEHTKFRLIMAQSCHLMYHIGFINSVFQSLTGSWPEYIGLSKPIA
jgi:hypothetical protein